MASTEALPDNQDKVAAIQQLGLPGPNVTAQAPRENMIETAMRFLQTPQVRQSPLAKKKVFLEKKGLTAHEIEIAVERSGTQQDIIQPAATVQTGTGQDMVAQQGIPMQQQLVPYGQPVPARVTTWRDYMAIAVIVSGVSYGIYKLIQNFLMPFLRSRQEESERLERLEASIQELNKSVLQMVQEVGSTVTSIQSLLEQQQAKIDNLSASTTTSRAISSHTKTTEIAEVKAEITSLKGLLLNRHQFPATPQPSPIPTWQLPRVIQTTDTTPAKPCNTQSPPPGDSLATHSPPPSSEPQLVAECTDDSASGESVSHSDGLVNGDAHNGSLDSKTAETSDMNIHEGGESFQSDVNQSEVVQETGVTVET